MYHSVLKDPGRSGQFIVTPDEVESDFRYLCEQGYTAVLVQDLIDFVYRGRPLPPKPVMITFDDGCLNNLTYVLPLLEQYDMRAVISVVGAYTVSATETPDANPNYAYLSIPELKQLHDSGRIELQNHSYNMHSRDDRRGCMQKSGESDHAYRTALTNDVTAAQRLLTDAGLPAPTAFAYPFGAFSQNTDAILRTLGFAATLSCSEHVNMITTDPDCLFQLGRFNRPSGITTKAFMTALEEK